MVRGRPRIRVYRENPPAAGAGITIERILPSGRTVERELGPRGLLDFDEAVALLDRPRDQVLRAIRAGFLRTTRRRQIPGARVTRRRYVTLQACLDFLREEDADSEAARRAGQEQAIPWEIARLRL